MKVKLGRITAVHPHTDDGPTTYTVELEDRSAETLSHPAWLSGELNRGDRVEVGYSSDPNVYPKILRAIS